MTLVADGDEQLGLEERGREVAATGCRCNEGIGRDPKGDYGGAGFERRTQWLGLGVHGAAG